MSALWFIIALAICVGIGGSLPRARRSRQWRRSQRARGGYIDAGRRPR